MNLSGANEKTGSLLFAHHKTDKKVLIVSPQQKEF